MTWARLRTWIGTHPVRAAGLPLAFATLIVICALAVYADSGPGSWDFREYTASVAACAFLSLPLVWFAYVTWLRERAGLPSGRVLWAIAWLVAPSALGLAGAAFIYHEAGCKFAQIGSSMAVYSGSFLALSPPAAVLGWAAARWIIRRQINRGRREMTIPLARERE